MATIPRIEPDLVINHTFPEVASYEYTERDVALYALGVGTNGTNALDSLELPFLYDSEDQTNIKVLPTFAVCFPHQVLNTIASINGLHYDPQLLLHGEQYTEIYRPLPTHAKIKNTIHVSGLHDKGKAAILELEILSHDAETGDVYCLNRSTIFLRGAGGFSSFSKPYSYTKRTTHLKINTPDSKAAKSGSPEAVPDFVYEDQTRPSQALLYRLLGDYNSLHSSPDVAAAAGFERPILHGLCTMGYAVRAIIRSCCNGDPTRIQSFQGRFLSHVYPGDQLKTEMWLDIPKSRVTYKTKVQGRYVLSGTVVLTSTPSRL